MRAAVAPSRLISAFNGVAPSHAPVQVTETTSGVPPTATIEVLGGRARLVWAGEGWPRDIERILASDAVRPGDVIVVKRMSPGAASAAADAGLGWIDEDGGADFTTPTLAVSRSARPRRNPPKPGRWTAQTMGVAEALLIGVPATVAAVCDATGFSEPTCTRALALFADSGVLSQAARRGRHSGRTLSAPDQLLSDYAAYAASQPARLELDANPLWSDIVDGVSSAGQAWDSAGIAWAATGAVAGHVLAPLLTNIGSAVVYVDASSAAELDIAARAVGAVPIGGRGRLVLRAFPSRATQRLAGMADGIRVAPWPRVYVDLRTVGVRGEEAAEHLREVVNADGQHTTVT